MSRSTNPKSRRFPTQEEIDEMDGLTFLRLRLGEYDGWDHDSIEYRLDEARIDAIVKYSSEMASRAGKKPRLARRHHHRDMAVRIGGEYLERDPKLSKRKAAIMTVTDRRWEEEKIGDDDIPSEEAIRKWL